MRKYMMIFLLLSFMTLSASTADSVRLSVTYQVRYANAEGENEAKQDVMKLDIGNSASHFYSWMNRMKEALIDSMNATGQINLEKIRKQVKPYQSGQAYHIYKNILVCMHSHRKRRRAAIGGRQAKVCRLYSSGTARHLQGIFCQHKTLYGKGKRRSVHQTLYGNRKH